MARDADFIFDVIQGETDVEQDLARVRLKLGSAYCEHRPILLVDDLDPQSFAGDVEQQLIAELFENRVALDGGFDALLQLGELLHLPFLELRVRGFEREGTRTRWRLA